MDDARADRVVVDQKVIQINDEEYWLSATVEPEKNNIRYAHLFPTFTISITEEFLAEVTEKQDVGDSIFLIYDADDLIGGLRDRGLSYRVKSHGDRNKVDRVFREEERRTSPFSNCFSHVAPTTPETG